MKTRFSDNSAYVVYERLLKELHRYLAAGQNDTPEVDAIHDQMDDLESRLSGEEIERLNGLSADLYMLDGDEILEPATLPTHQLGLSLQASYDQNNWNQVLRFLRMQNRPLSVDRVAYLRARAYDELGHLDTALVFMGYASEAKPDNENYEYFVISYLSRLNQSDKALQRAEQYIQFGNNSIDVRIQYAALLFMTAEGEEMEERTPILRRAIDVLSPLLQEARLDTNIPIAVLLLGFLTLGSCYEDLSRSDEALKAYSDALQIDPDNMDALTLRGILLAKSDWRTAISDLERVVENNSPNAAAYLYVAYDSLLLGEFARCIQICHKIQGMTDKADTLAAIWQWTAISQYHLDVPMITVIQNAQRASDFNPINLLLQETLNLFRSLSKAGRTAHPKPLDIQALTITRPVPRSFLHFAMAA